MQNVFSLVIEKTLSSLVIAYIVDMLIKSLILPIIRFSSIVIHQHLTPTVKWSFKSVTLQRQMWIFN